MKTIIITGSCGLIGHELSNFFLRKNFRVIGIDNNFRKFFFGSKASVKWVEKILIKKKNYFHYKIDIRNKKNLENKIFKKIKNVKGVIHCAAQPSHDWAKIDPELDFEINSKATMNLLLLTKKYFHESPFVYLSTNKVYGDKINLEKFKEKKYRYEISKKSKFYNKGVNESFSIDQSMHSLFGCSKLSADLMVQEFGRIYKMKTVCFRGGCLTGPMHSGAKLHGFLSYLVKCYVKNDVYYINGFKGKQVRDNIHSLDLARAVWEYFKKPRSGEVYNIGGGKKSNCSILEAIKICENIGNKKFNYKILNKSRDGDHLWWISDMSKFKKHYPKWKQEYDIKKLIKEMFEYLL